MNEKSPKKNLLNDCKDLIDEQKDNFVILNKNTKIKRDEIKNISINRKSIKRILTKKQNYIFPLIIHIAKYHQYKLFLSKKIL